MRTPDQDTRATTEDTGIIFAVTTPTVGTLPRFPWCAFSGTRAHAVTVKTAKGGIAAGPVQTKENQERNTNPPVPPITATVATKVKQEPSPVTGSLDRFRGDVEWSSSDFIRAHNEVVSSGRYNFEGSKIPIPTSIRYDRLEEALGPDITPKEIRTLKLLEFGFP